MKTKIQLFILFATVLAALSILAIHWIKQSDEKNEIDEVHELFSDIKSNIKSNTMLSFTSKSPTMRGIILFDYALLTAAPIVITDNNFEQDTILALDDIVNNKPNAYKDYTIIAKSFGNNFALQLMVKKNK